MGVGSFGYVGRVIGLFFEVFFWGESFIIFVFFGFYFGVSGNFKR